MSRTQKARVSKVVRRAMATLCFAAISTAANAFDSFRGILDGNQVFPATASPAEGLASLAGDATSLDVFLEFAGLVATSVAAHIHCCADPPTNAGVAITLTGFPLGVSSGTYVDSFDLSSTTTFNSSFLTGAGGTAALATAQLYAGLRALRGYVDIHTTVYPAGEIRAYLPGIFADGFESGDPLEWSAYPGWD